MSLLKPINNGRMYDGWWRWNPIGGCLHGCSYCYMKAMSKRTGKDMMTPTGLREEYLNDNLGSGRKIFVGSSGDMWGKWVDEESQWAVKEHCRKHPDNEYMFLTKNPEGYMTMAELVSLNCIIGATIETDLDIVACSFSSAPTAWDRLRNIGVAKNYFPSLRTMVSIEPVMKFSRDFATVLRFISPDIIYIGRDTGHNGLPEPTDDELRALVTELLDAGIDVRLKKSLDGLMEV